MRLVTIMFSACAFACTVQATQGPGSDGGASVDPGTTPVLTSCTPGSLVEKTSLGWDCVAPSSLSVLASSNASSAETAADAGFAARATEAEHASAADLASYALDAGFANHAVSADNSAHATSADSSSSAAVADYANDAGVAANALSLGGQPAENFLSFSNGVVALPGDLLAGDRRVVVSATLTDGGSSEISVGGTFCGVSGAQTTGAFLDPSTGATGYRAAKLICETVASCGPSRAAHMCTNEEFVRSQQLGDDGFPAALVDAGTYANAVWVSSGTYNYAYISSSYGTLVTTDCSGWTYGSGPTPPGAADPSGFTVGNAWYFYPGLGWRPYGGIYGSCASTYQIACCR